MVNYVKIRQNPYIYIHKPHIFICISAHVHLLVFPIHGRTTSSRRPEKLLHGRSQPTRTEPASPPHRAQLKLLPASPGVDRNIATQVRAPVLANQPPRPILHQNADRSAPAAARSRSSAPPARLPGRGPPGGAVRRGAGGAGGAARCMPGAVRAARGCRWRSGSSGSGRSGNAACPGAPLFSFLVLLLPAQVGCGPGGRCPPHSLSPRLCWRGRRRRAESAPAAKPALSSPLPGPGRGHRRGG